MLKSFEIATFNVQNLFTRVKVFNYKDHDKGDGILTIVFILLSPLVRCADRLQ